MLNKNYKVDFSLKFGTDFGMIRLSKNSSFRFLFQKYDLDYADLNKI
jgi:hypothetical protein